MARKKKLKIPFKRTIYDEATMERLRRDIERVEAIRCENYEKYRKRPDFELEQVKKAYRLSPQTVQYLKSQGMRPMGIPDYSETDFEAWLARDYRDTAQIRWRSRIVTIAAYLLPRNTREEWLGDLQESIQELTRSGCPRWMRILITTGRICLLCYALAWIRICDLVSLAKRGRM
jgi:hypothetical protein